MQTAAPFFMNMKRSYAPISEFTVIPSGLSNPNAQYRVADEMFGVKEGENVFSEPVEYYDIRVLFKAPSLRTGEGGTLPSIVRYLNELPTVKAFNKLIAEYNKEKGVLILALAEGERLLIANCYKTPDFGSAIYYILEALKQNQLNPQQTVVNLYAALGSDDLEKIQKYVKGVKICAL